MPAVAGAAASYPFAKPPSSSPSVVRRPVPVSSVFSPRHGRLPASSSSSFAAPPSSVADIADSGASHKRRDAAEASSEDSKKQKQQQASSASGGSSPQSATQHSASAFTVVPATGTAHSALTSASFDPPTTQSLLQSPQQQQQQQASAFTATSSASATAGSSGPQPQAMYPSTPDTFAHYPLVNHMPMQGQMMQPPPLPSHSPATAAQQQPQQPQPQVEQPSPPELPVSPTELPEPSTGSSSPVAAQPSGSLPSILSISTSNTLPNGVRVYPKYNDLLCCRHMCGCRRSKFDCSKSLPAEQLDKLRQQHLDKVLRALMRQRPELTKEEAQSEVGDVTYMSGVAIIKRASRTQHEQNAALHTCGQRSESGSYVDYPCRKMLKLSKQPTRPAAAPSIFFTPLLSPFPPIAGQPAPLTDTSELEEVQDEDSLLSLLYGTATKAMLSTREEFVPSSILRLVPQPVLERHHTRGLALPFTQVPASVGSEYLSSYWEGDSTIKLVQLPVLERAPSKAKNESSTPSLHDWARISTTAEHSKLLIASLRSAASVAGGEPCAAVDVRDHILRSLGCAHVPQFLRQLALGTNHTYLSTWLPASADVKVAKTDRSVDLALHALTNHSNLLRLLATPPSSLTLPSSSPFVLSSADPSLSHVPAELSPRCTLFAGSGYRPFGCSALFSSAAVRLSPVDTGCVAWLVVPAAHRSRAELIMSHEARRQLSKDNEPLADSPTDPPPSALLVLLYAGLLFVDPTVLLINGVPVQLVSQTAAHLFVRGGDMLLGCVVLGGAAVTVYEQPFLPVAWLKEGPTRCQHWLQWIRTVLPASASEQSPLRPAVRAALRRIFPEPYSSNLFAAITADVTQHLAPSSPATNQHEPQQQQQDEAKQANPNPKKSGRGKQSQCVMDYRDLSEVQLKRALAALAACQTALAQLEG